LRAAHLNLDAALDNCSVWHGPYLAWLLRLQFPQKAKKSKQHLVLVLLRVVSAFTAILVAR